MFANIGGAVPGDTYNKVLFKNPGGHGNHWLSIRLVGAKSNRAAIGAKIKLTIAGEGEGKDSMRFREVTSGGSLGASSLVQEIGLGKAKRVKTLEVWWSASNTRQTFRDVAADQFIEIKEFDNNYTVRQLRSFDLGSKKTNHPATH
ncbi:MAG: ASPIC/UnbV domain-containing protein [Pyrinomonadaceae bacterium]